VPVPTPPGGSSIIQIKIEPDPVRYSGRPITDVAGCRILAHTWFYTQIVHNTTGKEVTLNLRENFFDGRFTSKNEALINLERNGTARIETRWCSGYPTQHYAQTRYSGRTSDGEKITISGPWVVLHAK
jgi:hypothetical protein